VAGALDWEGDIHCVTRWSRFGMRWRGLAVAPLLERAGLSAGAGYHHRGDPWAQERYSVEDDVARARRREVRAAGADL
jgi:DMSO/TMAO reductase YedYZ molybdopterin-dependent catalytic subunit